MKDQELSGLFKKAMKSIDEVIDEDELITEEDKEKKIVIKSKSTKKRACSNCICGLANEEKEQENKKDFKSECGNCYLGDAFRCEGCPKTGFPAYDPGEEVFFDLDDEK